MGDYYVAQFRLNTNVWQEHILQDKFDAVEKC